MVALSASALLYPCASKADGDVNEDHLIAILQNSLLDLEPNQARTSPGLSMSKYQQNNSLRLQDVNWVYTVPAHPVTVGPRPGLTFVIKPLDHNLSGSTVLSGMNVRSDRRDVNRATSFSLTEINPVPLNLFGASATVSVRGSFAVSKCDFNFATNPTCFPQVTITNTSAPDADAPNITFQVDQTGSSPVHLIAGKTAILDRSAGDMTISLVPLEAQIVRAIAVSVTINEGPDLTVGNGISLVDRAKTYDQLLTLHQELDQAIAATGDPQQAIKAKTLTTAIHVMSAEAVYSKYPDVVHELLVTRAKDIADVSQRFLDIRNLVIASNEMTPAQIDLLVTRINLLLADPTLSDRDALTLIRDQLIKAKNAVSDTSQAVAVVRDNFTTSLDRVVKEYQMYILEYAQYITNDDLKTTLGDQIRQAIATRLTPSDIVITDASLAGRGPVLRADFGLPAPK